MLLAVQPSVRRSVVGEGAITSAEVRQVILPIPWASRGRILKENQETLQVAFPPTFEIAVYLQPPFNGPADATCSWGIVSSHQGDVRQCPATSAPIRPPERILGANATLAGNSTGTMISALPFNETTISTSTAAFDLNLTSVKRE